MKKNNKTLGIILICLFVFSSIMSLYSVNASSAETTGLSLSYTNTNFNKYLNTGGFDIFATDKKIIFYDPNDGSLIKTYDLTFAGGGTYSYIDTSIMYYNSTAILVTWNYYASTGAHTYLYAIFLNINTLIEEYLATAYYPDANGGTATAGSSITCYINGNYYVIYNYKDNHATHTNTIVYRVSPTPTLIGYLAGKLFYGSTIYVSASPTNELWVISETSSGNNRFNVYYINVVTPSSSLIGTSGLDDTWGDYVYYFGTSEHTDGVSTWTDIGVVYNNPSVAQNIHAQICRMNDTTVSYYRTSNSVSSAVNVIRCLSVSHTGIWDRTSLIDGDYQYYYVGSSYGIMLSPMELWDINTETPLWTIPYYDTIFGDNGVQFYHHYTSANSVGGYLVPSGNFINYDYQNLKCVVDHWISLNPTYAYTFSLIPEPIHIISSGTILRAVCWQSQDYTYIGEIFVDGTRLGNGTYTVSSTGLSTNYDIDSEGTYSGTSTTGSIINGVLNFTISGRISSYTTIYEGVRVTITINGYPATFDHLFVWTIDPEEDGLTPTTPTFTPQPTNNTIGSGGGAFSVSVLGGLILCLVFALLFGAFAGRDGLLIGLMIGVFISSVSGLFPIYGIILAIIIGAVTVMSHSGIGSNVGNGGNS